MPDTAQPADFDAQFFRSALGRFPSGVTVITAQGEHGPLGLTISSFSSLSLEPPLVLWTLSRKASTLAQLERAQRYVIHVLSAQQLSQAHQFASGPQERRFEGVALTQAPGGTPMLDDPHCAAWFECYNLQRHAAGDHVIFVGQVERCHRSFLQPLVYHAGDFDLTPAQEPLTPD